ncbi:O-antigen ligase family protein [Acinetobacter indicus]|uniref:O-antigen ligase family protein n=1 Tax=Acinetobacter indicus TaxID=756892 RepID=UPI000CEC5A6A|nr:O-antigen ligase family protein [Acinetobacter indicus]
MILKKKNFIYCLYFFMVIISFALSLNIFNAEFRWFLNKIFYLVFISLFFLIVDVKGFNRRNLIIFSLIIMYIVSIFYTSLINFGIISGFAFFISKGLLYGLITILLLEMVVEFDLKKVLFPFFVLFNIIIFLSILVYLGFEPKYYLDNDESLDYYIGIKDRDSISGFSGIFLNQNTLGIFCFLTIVLNYIFINIYNEKKIIFSIVFLLITSLLFLLLTLSRGAIVSFILFFFIISLKFYRYKSMYIFYCIIFLMFSIFYLNFNDFFEKLLFRMENDGTSLRTEIWANAFETIKNNLYFGVGDFKYVNYLGHELSAHNAYIQKIASDGLIAFLLWLFLILITLFFSISHIFKYDNKVIIAINVVFICILVNQFFESMILNIFNPITLFFILIVSIILNGRYLKY